MTENLAARGEGLAGLKLCPSCQAADNNAYTDANGVAMRACMRCMIQWRDLEPAAPAGTPVDEPKNDDRAYGCYTCGKQGLKKGQRVSLVYCNECDAKHIEEVRRAALATPAPQAPPEPTAEHNRLAASLCGCGTPYMSDCERCERIAAALAKVPRSGEQSSGLGRSKGEPFNLSPNAESAPSSAATQEQPAGSGPSEPSVIAFEKTWQQLKHQMEYEEETLRRVPNDWPLEKRTAYWMYLSADAEGWEAGKIACMSGSPRKVGEDAPCTDKHHDMGGICWTCGRPSSVPLGEQK